MVKYKFEYAQYIPGSFVIHGYCTSMCVHDLLYCGPRLSGQGVLQSNVSCEYFIGWCIDALH